MHATVDIKNQVHTLVDLLRFRAAMMPDQVVYTFLPDNGNEPEVVTFGELDKQARALAAQLNQHDGFGERALMLFPSGLEFIVAFFGCLYAGVIGVPAYPPRKNHNLNRLQSIITDCQPKFVLSTSKVMRVAEPMFKETEGLSDGLVWVATDEVSPELASQWQDKLVVADDLAFLQYTSGSTGSPKGVMVSHGNLIHNEAMMTQGLNFGPDVFFASWLPLFHDLGLIGATLQPLYMGGQSVLMTPASFLQRPIRWMQAISDYRANTAVAPNFAYELCARQISKEQKEGLDLSCWTRALSGAEAIRSETLDRFTAAFEPYGFKRSSFHGTYGLAEATLFVSGGGKHPRPVVKTVSGPELQENKFVEVPGGNETDLDVVGIGETHWRDQEVIIVDPEAHTHLEEGQIGEIWIKGENVAKGYWQRPEATKETFQAYTKDNNDGPYLRTGDLGTQIDGELFFTGRQKELIIIRGRNHYPHDIEKTVESCHEALRADNNAAFTIEVDGEDRLVVAQEVERRYRLKLDVEEVSRAARQAVAEKHELQLYAIVYLKPGRVQKTSSGKIQRRGMQQSYLNGSLEILAESKLDSSTLAADSSVDLTRQALLSLDAADRAEQTLAYLKQELILASGASSNDIDPQESLLQFGLDSLHISQLATHLRDQFQIELSQQDLLNAETLNDIALLVVDRCEHVPSIHQNQIKPAPDLSEWPLSYSQQRLWFLEKLEQGGTAYNLSSAVKMKGPIDRAHLIEAIISVLQRHEALRTAFVEQNGEPSQLVKTITEWDLPEERLEGLADTAKLAAIQGLATTDSARPFDLSSGVLMRTRLLRCGNNSKGEPESILIITVHHIAADGWSMNVFLNELTEAYQAIEYKREQELQELPVQYKDYAVWQREYLNDQHLQPQLDYWQQQLAGAPVLEMPTQKRRPSVRSGHGAGYRFVIPENLSKELQALAKREGVTLYMLLLSVFKVLLYRYSANQDICVGSPIAGRTRPELDQLIGFFVNTLVLRTDLGDNPSFSNYLAQVKRVTLDAYANQDLPFERIVEALGVKRDMSYTPLFQVMFAFQNSPINIDGNNPFGLETLDLEIHSSKFDLTLNIETNKGRLHGDFEYSTDLFDREYIEKLALHYETLLRSVAADAEQSIASLELLSSAEKNELLIGLNQTQEDFPWEITLNELFENQVAATPDKVAVIDQDREITFADLNVAANKLARHLQSLGVTKESLVGISAERSVDIITSMLAIHKAGGAYVPLDPNYPADRVAYMLEDAKAPVVLTHDSIKADLPSTQAKIVSLDGDAALWESNDEANLEEQVSPQQLAYVIYTSGSTGLPKGVAIEHRNTSAMVQWAHGVFPSEDLQGVLFATSVCFDLSVWEIFVTLTAGGTVIVCENAIELPNLPAKDKVTLINTVPSAIAALERQQQIPESVKIINLAGEALAQSLVDKLYDLDHIEKVYDLYGPSEDTTYSTYTLREHKGFANIGRPISNTQAYLLDSYGSLVPRGIPGELYLAGWGITRGYLNREELTAEKFLPNPFAEQCSEHGARVYRTGDLVRYLDDGRLEYLGRIDHQVKIRGFRIELGEVESTLGKHEALREGLVMTQLDEHGEKIMVAYIVVKPECQKNPPSIKELRAHIKSSLPEYMVPSAFVFMEKFPLTPNGKVDRKALPAADLSSLSVTDYVVPATEIEVELCKIWEEVLLKSPIGVADDFFALGGHSLLATQIIARIREAFGVELVVKDLFRATTITELAEVVSSASNHVDSLAVSIPLVDRDQPLELSSAQQRLWFLDQMESREAGYKTSTSYNMSGAVRLTGPLNIDALAWTFEEIVARHETLRTNVKVEEGLAVQVIHGRIETFLDVRDLSNVDADHLNYKVKAYMLDEATRSFDIELNEKARRTRLLRTRLLKLGEEEHILLVTMHHMISDGWSLGVLMKEVAHLYEAYQTDQVNRLDPLPIQYADYAAWQNQKLRDNEYSSQIDYWKEVLADVPNLDLATDFSRPPVQTFRGSRIDFVIPDEVSAAFNELCSQNGVTLFMGLVSALDILLQRKSGQDDFCIGTPIANRTHRSLENLIGCFVNTLALRADLGGNPTVQDVLAQIQETTLGAYANQDVPFEVLVDELDLARDMSRSPLFQVMFGFQNTPREQVSGFSDIKTEILPNQAQSAKFDLTINMMERDGNLVGEWEFNTDLYKRETVEAYIEHFQQILAAMAENAESHISELAMLNEDEEQQLLGEVTNSAAIEAYASRDCLHEIFEQRAAEEPDAIAVTMDDVEFTYDELNSRANQLAHYLIEEGVQPDMLVGICVDRSLDMIVALLGVLKAGAAYLPIDPTNPEDRIAFILEDGLGHQDLQLVITQSMVVDCLPAGSIQPLLIDDEWDLIDSQSDQNIEESRATADNRAYVIYTSGTTGKPKGVLIPHRNVTRLFSACDGWFDFNQSNQVWTLFHSFAFDFSVWEIWGALLHGGHLVIVPYEVSRSPSAFYQMLIDQQVTVLSQTPSAFTQLIHVDGEQTELVSSQLKLRQVVFGGEALDFAALQSWVQRHGLDQPELINMYGITETTVHVTYHKLVAEDLEQKASIIGVPIPDLQTVIVDAHNNPVPVGVPGELLVGGAGVSDGYLNRPDLTSERFINNPWVAADQKLYRTGDLVRRLHNGTLEYLGRIDDQVKIRGFRIELGEIESVVLQHSGVRDAVVLVREDTPGDKRIVAYVAASSSTTAADLKIFAKKSLPEYMVPAHIMVLEELPLTGNGKIDKKALPKPDGRDESEVAYVAPRNETEASLAKIWGEVLGLGKIGVQDLFFDVGGNSLLATQVISRVRSEFQVDIPLSALFEQPTVEAMALYILEAEVEDLDMDDDAMLELLAEIEDI